MTKEEHAQVLAALEAITKHFSISRLHESTLADTTVRGQAHEAIAIMRKEPEPISDAEIFKLADEYCAATWVEMLDEGFSFEKSDLIKFIRALLERAAIGEKAE